jgi:hypothetical protein
MQMEDGRHDRLAWVSTTLIGIRELLESSSQRAERKVRAQPKSKAAGKSVRPTSSSQLDNNVPGRQLPFVLGEDGGPFDYVAQLSHVARPAMLKQLEGGFRTQRHPVRTESA